MKITIETIPHNEQRYNTVGDWQFDKEGNLNIKVSDMGLSSYQNALIIHELVEALLCQIHHVSEHDVDAFDINYKGNYSEPGDDPHAPYHQEHIVASFIEQALAIPFGILNWLSYCSSIEDITYVPESK